jgi:hypothetical protein
MQRTTGYEDPDPIGESDDIDHAADKIRQAAADTLDPHTADRIVEAVCDLRTFGERIERVIKLSAQGRDSASSELLHEMIEEAITEMATARVRVAIEEAGVPA